jgi:hypothetical protein
VALETHAGTQSVGKRPRNRVSRHVPHVGTTETGLTSELTLEREGLGVVIGDDLAGGGGLEPGLLRGVIATVSQKVPLAYPSSNPTHCT